MADGISPATDPKTIIQPAARQGENLPTPARGLLRMCRLCCACLVLVVQAASVSAEIDLGRLGRIESLIENAIRDGRLPGAVVVVGHAGKIVYDAAFGARVLDGSTEAMTSDTVFDLASLTKVVATTTSVMILVEERRLRLRDPVVTYLPEFTSHGKDRIRGHTQPGMEIKAVMARVTRSGPSWFGVCVQRDAAASDTGAGPSPERDPALHRGRRHPGQPRRLVRPRVHGAPTLILQPPPREEAPDVRLYRRQHIDDIGGLERRGGIEAHARVVGGRPLRSHGYGCSN